MRIFLIFIGLFLALSSHSQTIESVKKELHRQGVPHADIVLAQARLETGNFTSQRCKVYHNILGIKHNKKNAKYAKWQDCIADYKKCISSRYTGGDYYAFLKRIGYAKDPKYIQKLKQF
jgi:flagellum-specific peptidoglycan hydrolase FlgJ